MRLILIPESFYCIKWFKIIFSTIKWGKKGEIYALQQFANTKATPDCKALEWVSRSLWVKNWKCTWDAVCGSQVYKLCPVLPGGSKALLSLHFVLSLLTHHAFCTLSFHFPQSQHRTLLSSEGLQKFPHLLRWKTSNKEREVQNMALRQPCRYFSFWIILKPWECFVRTLRCLICFALNAKSHMTSCSCLQQVDWGTSSVRRLVDANCHLLATV